MKRQHYALLSLLVILPLFIPSIQPSEKITVLPNTPESIIYNVNTPRIEFSSTSSGMILVNISKITNDGNERLFTNEVIDGELDIDMGSAGFFLFTIQSDTLSEIEIQNKGVYIPILLLLGISLIWNGFSLYQKFGELE